METARLKKKLKAQFSEIIDDESKLIVLEGLLDALSTKVQTSNVTEEHYRIVEERMRKHLVGETEVEDWDTVKMRLKKKHGF